MIVFGKCSRAQGINKSTTSLKLPQNVKQGPEERNASPMPVNSTFVYADDNDVEILVRNQPTLKCGTVSPIPYSRLKTQSANQYVKQ